MRTFYIPVILLAACAEPPQPNTAALYADSLREIHSWHPYEGAKGHYAYDAMLSALPNESAPVLIAKIPDTTSTAIHDALHDPVPVGNVAFHILLKVFGLKAETFEAEGVWVMEKDPSKNPIFSVHLDSDEVRERVARRFRAMAMERGWIIP